MVGLPEPLDLEKNSVKEPGVRDARRCCVVGDVDETEFDRSVDMMPEVPSSKDERVIEVVCNI
jgi:hypothetical protein